MSQVELPQVSLQRYVDLVKRRRWQLVPISLLGLLVGGLVAFLIPRYYVAETQIEHNAVPGEEATRGEDPFRGVVDTARVSIPLVARKAAEDLQWAEAMVADPHERAQFDKDLQSRIYVADTNPDPKRQFALVKVYFRDRNGQRAAAFLNTLIATWIESRTASMRAPVAEQRRLAKLSYDAWTKQWETLNDDKSQLELRYRIDPTVSVELQNQAFRDAQQATAARIVELAKLEGQVAGLASRLAQQQQRLGVVPPRVPPRSEQLTELAKKVPGGPMLLAAIENKRLALENLVPGTPLYREVEATIAQWETRLRDLLSTPETGGDGLVPNPDHQKLQDEIAALQAQHEALAAQAKVLRGAAEAEELRLKELVLGWKEYTTKLDQLKAAESERSLRKADLDRAEQLLAKLDSKPPVKVPKGSEATVPPRPTEPNIALVALVGCVLGLAAAIGLILLLDVLQGSFKTIEDVEHSLPVPVLGGMSHLETEEERRELVRVRKRNSVIGLLLLGLGGAVLLIYLLDPTSLPSFVRNALSFLFPRQ